MICNKSILMDMDFVPLCQWCLKDYYLAQVAINLTTRTGGHDKDRLLTGLPYRSHHLRRCAISALAQLARWHNMVRIPPHLPAFSSLERGAKTLVCGSASATPIR